MTKEDFNNYTPVLRDDKYYIIDNTVEHMVMDRGEEEYLTESIKQICRRVQPKSVIELGFGAGISSDEFQRQGVTTHIIIESNRWFYNEALKWAEGKRGVRVIHARHQDVLADDLPAVDLIYHDTYELVDIENTSNWHLRSNWYAEFCVDDAEDGSEAPDYFRFEIGRYKKLQLLVENNVERSIT